MADFIRKDQLGISAKHGGDMMLDEVQSMVWSNFSKQ